MTKWCGATLALVFVFLSAAALAEGQSREQLKGLDEQVQELKTDVLGIAADLSRLEEKLLYPSNTQASLFLSLGEGETFRLDSVAIEVDGKPAVKHLYTYKELEALRQGGVQRIYTGNLKTGEHDLHVTVTGKSESGDELRREAGFKIDKGVGPKLVELVLTDSGSGSRSITLRNW